MRFQLAFFFGYTEKEMGELTIPFVLMLMNGLKDNADLAAIKALGKGMTGGP